MSPIVIVDRMHEELPAYCIHGETFCTFCGMGCWLGDKTAEAMLSGARPLCHDCALELYHAGHLPIEKRVAHLHDHLRSEGPH